jgi:hypothetical protein
MSRQNYSPASLVKNFSKRLLKVIPVHGRDAVQGSHFIMKLGELPHVKPATFLASMLAQ